ncbi:MAG: TetR/AcrR family transcriptional regulator [Sphingobacteriales bacterium]|nr:MAG: TetR/AcrR family transcriptional regulator [Sphingobacteriales bacterium]
MDETQKKILQQAFTLFTKFGIRNVSMDDIAAHLGVSKKTLYQHIDNKAELIHKAMELHLANECNVTNELYESAPNAIEEMLSIADHVCRQLSMMHPSAIYELKKYYPESWELLEQHRIEHIYGCIVQNINKGIKQGLYRNDLKPELIAGFYIAKTRTLIGDNFFTKTSYKPTEILLEMMQYHIYGIATPDGVEYFRKNVEKIKSQKYAPYF